MKQLPIVNSKVQVLRVEVWVTNRNGSTTDTRDVAAFMDLGERNPYRTGLINGSGDNLPRNEANNLYADLRNNPNFRNSSLIQNALTSYGLLPVQDLSLIHI